MSEQILFCQIVMEEIILLKQNLLFKKDGKVTGLRVNTIGKLRRIWFFICNSDTNLFIRTFNFGLYDIPAAYCNVKQSLLIPRQWMLIEVLADQKQLI